MKHGRTLQELAVEISRQQSAKRDFLPYMQKVEAFAHEGALNLGFQIQDNDSELFTAGLTKNGHSQLATYTGIPSRYYEVMKGHPGLLAHNVKHWLNLSSDRRMIRTLDGNIRAIMSEKYRRLDNYDLLNHVLPMLNEVKAEVESCEVTEDRLYIKAITHKVQAEIKKGDVVSAGIIISNSEVGKGMLSVKPLVLRLVCMNGAIADDYAMKKYHIGRAAELDQIEFSNETLNAEDKAFWLKTRDLVKFSLNEVTFEKVVNSMRESTERKIEEPTKAIELATKKYSLQETEQADVLKHLIAGGDLSSYGLGNAVTRMAQDVESYDRSTELEAIGFEIMQQNWN